MTGDLGSAAKDRAGCADAKSQQALKAVTVTDFAEEEQAAGGDIEITGGVTCAESGRFELFLPPERVQDNVIVHELSHLDFNNSIQATLGASSCEATGGIATDAEVVIAGEVVASAEELLFTGSSLTGAALIGEAARRSTAEAGFRGDKDLGFRLIGEALKNAGIPHDLVKDSNGKNTDINVKGGDIGQLRNRRNERAEELIKQRTGKDLPLKSENDCPDDTEEPPRGEVPVEEGGDGSLLAFDFGLDFLLDPDVLICDGPCDLPRGIVIIEDCPSNGCTVPDLDFNESFEYSDVAGGESSYGGGGDSSYGGGGDSSYGGGGGSSYGGGGGSSYGGGGALSSD